MREIILKAEMEFLSIIFFPFVKILVSKKLFIGKCLKCSINVIIWIYKASGNILCYVIIFFIYIVTPLFGWFSTVLFLEELWLNFAMKYFDESTINKDFDRGQRWFLSYYLMYSEYLMKMKKDESWKGLLTVGRCT